MGTQMTFGDLEKMIDYWTTYLHDFQHTFQNQSEEIKNVFWRTGCNDTEMKLIETKLGILHYNHLKVEEDILNTSAIQQNMERAIVQLEKHLMDLEGKVPTDNERETYRTAENINLSLSYYKNEIELSVRDTERQETEILKDPVEQIAKIMVALLESLLYIETKTENMKNGIRWIEDECKIILCQRTQAN